jgi:hypothetical protein
MIGGFCASQSLLLTEMIAGAMVMNNLSASPPPDSLT